jgi:hypothetical protein
MLMNHFEVITKILEKRTTKTEMPQSPEERTVIKYKLHRQWSLKVYQKAKVQTFALAMTNEKTTKLFPGSILWKRQNEI